MTSCILNVSFNLSGQQELMWPCNLVYVYQQNKSSSTEGSKDGACPVVLKLCPSWRERFHSYNERLGHTCLLCSKKISDTVLGTQSNEWTTITTFCVELKAQRQFLNLRKTELLHRISSVFSLFPPINFLFDFDITYVPA